MSQSVCSHFLCSPPALSILPKCTLSCDRIQWVNYRLLIDYENDSNPPSVPSSPAQILAQPLLLYMEQKPAPNKMQSSSPLKCWSFLHRWCLRCWLWPEIRKEKMIKSGQIHKLVQNVLVTNWLLPYKVRPGEMEPCNVMYYITDQSVAIWDTSAKSVVIITCTAYSHMKWWRQSAQSEFATLFQQSVSVVTNLKLSRTNGIHNNPATSSFHCKNPFRKEAS